MMDNWKEYIAVDDAGINERLETYRKITAENESTETDKGANPMCQSSRVDTELVVAREQLRLALATLDEILDK